MSKVQQIEAAVGKDRPLAMLLPLSDYSRQILFAYDLSHVSSAS
jgi:hypothetical protein